MALAARLTVTVPSLPPLADAAGRMDSESPWTRRPSTVMLQYHHTVRGPGRISVNTDSAA